MKHPEKFHQYLRLELKEQHQYNQQVRYILLLDLLIQSQQLFEIYQNNEENEFCKIFPNNFFGYTKVVVEQPLIEDGDIKTDRQGNPKADTSKRDTERVPLSESIDDYYDREVRPHLSDSWMDRSKDKVGYEINFTKYFYQFNPLRTLDEISRDLKTLDDEIQKLSLEMTNE